MSDALLTTDDLYAEATRLVIESSDNLPQCGWLRRAARHIETLQGELEAIRIALDGRLGESMVERAKTVWHLYAEADNARERAEGAREDAEQALGSARGATLKQCGKWLTTYAARHHDETVNPPSHRVDRTDHERRLLKTIAGEMLRALTAAPADPEPATPGDTDARLDGNPASPGTPVGDHGGRADPGVSFSDRPAIQRLFGQSAPRQAAGEAVDPARNGDKRRGIVLGGQPPERLTLYSPPFDRADLTFQKVLSGDDDPQYNDLPCEYVRADIAGAPLEMADLRQVNASMKRALDARTNYHAFAAQRDVARQKLADVRKVVAKIRELEEFGFPAATMSKLLSSVAETFPAPPAKVPVTRCAQCVTVFCTNPEQCPRVVEAAAAAGAMGATFDSLQPALARIQTGVREGLARRRLTPMTAGEEIAHLEEKYALNAAIAAKRGFSSAPPPATERKLLPFPAPERVTLYFYPQLHDGLGVAGDGATWRHQFRPEGPEISALYVRADVAAYGVDILAALIAALPKCDVCGEPATRAWVRGSGRWCDEHRFEGSLDRKEPEETPEYPRAVPLRAGIAYVARMAVRDPHAREPSSP